MAADTPFATPEPRPLIPLCLQLDSGRDRIIDITKQIVRFYVRVGIQISLDAERVTRMLREGAILLHQHEEETGQLIGTAVLVTTQTFTSRIGHVYHLLITESHPPDEQLRRAHTKNLLQELIRRARERQVDQIELRDPRARATALELGFKDEGNDVFTLSL